MRSRMRSVVGMYDLHRDGWYLPVANLRPPSGDDRRLNRNMMHHRADRAIFVRMAVGRVALAWPAQPQQVQLTHDPSRRLAVDQQAAATLHNPATPARPASRPHWSPRDAAAVQDAHCHSICRKAVHVPGCRTNAQHAREIASMLPPRIHVRRALASGRSTFQEAINAAPQPTARVHPSPLVNALESMAGNHFVPVLIRNTRHITARLQRHPSLARTPRPAVAYHWCLGGARNARWRCRL
jgi:hypothetical protein